MANGFIARRLLRAGGRPDGDRRLLADQRENGRKSSRRRRRSRPRAQEEGYAGGGLWSTPAYDPTTKYAYWGAGNPNSKTKQYRTTDAILKIDVNPSRPTFGQIVASYEGNVDQYTQTLQELSHSPACEASDNPTASHTRSTTPSAVSSTSTSVPRPTSSRPAAARKVVGDLQKSGVYHVADAKTMAPVWSTLRRPILCSPATPPPTAFDGSSIYGVATPGGTMFSLEPQHRSQELAQPDRRRHPLPVGQHRRWSRVDRRQPREPRRVRSRHRPAARAPAVERRRRRACHQPHERRRRDRRARLFVAAGGASYSSATGYVIAYGAP